MIDALAIAWQRPGLWPAVAAALLLALALVGWAYGGQARGATGLPATRKTRWSGAALRIAALVALAVIWIGPSRTAGDPAPPAPARPPLAVLLDTSGSMNETDGTDRARLQRLAAPWLAPDAWRPLSAAAEITLFRFDETVVPIDRAEARQLEPSPRAATALRRALDSVSQRTRAAGAGATVLLLSDGHETVDVSSADADDSLARLADVLAARGVTVFANTVSAAPRAQPDYKLIAAPTTSTVFAGESVEIAAIVSRDGALGPQPIEVDLLHEGGVVQTAEAAFAEGDRRTTVRFEHTPDDPAGEGPRGLLYRLKLRPIEGERTAANNERAVAVRQFGRRMRVLLLEGEPGSPARFLMAVLRRDARVALTSVQAVSNQRTLVTRHAGADHNASAETADLAERLKAADASVFEAFDAVVLGRRIDRLVTNGGAEALVAFVKRGGGLWLMRGDPFGGDADAAAAIEAISPVSWGERVVAPMRLSLTRAAERGEAVGLGPDVQLDKLPLMLAGTRTVADRSATVVWMRQRPVGAAEAPKSASIVWHRVGAGRVLAMLSEGFWRWAMLPPRLDDYRAAYRGLVSSMIRRAALGDAFEARRGIALDAAPINAVVGRPVRVTVRSRFIKADALAGDAVTVNVTGPDGGSQTIALSPDAGEAGVLYGSFTPTAAGRYELTARAASLTEQRKRISLVAAAPSGELDNTEPRPTALAALAERTGGRMLEPGQWRPLVAHLEAEAASVDERAMSRESASEAPAWDRWWVFALLATALTVEWFVRRGGGMA